MDSDGVCALSLLVAITTFVVLIVMVMRYRSMKIYFGNSKRHTKLKGLMRVSRLRHNN